MQRSHSLDRRHRSVEIPSRLSIDDCRRLLLREDEFTDQELVRLRDQLYEFAIAICSAAPDTIRKSVNHRRHADDLEHTFGEWREIKAWIGMADADVEEYEERSVIMEIEGGLDRLDADYEAMSLLLRQRQWAARDTHEEDVN